MASSKASNAGISHKEQREQKVLDVMFLCDEWKSSKGGLSTFNREFAINLAQATTGSMKIHCYVSNSDDRDRKDAKQHGVNLITARNVPGSADPLEGLKFSPPELPNPHLVIGHGRKLGCPAYSLLQNTKCKWIQFVHVYCEDLGKYKESATAAEDTIEENEKKHKMEIELCKAADAVVAVGSRLQQKYSRRLLKVKVEIITPGIFGKFSNESKLAVDRSVVKNFNVSLFGRAAFEDLSLKGYDVVANAIGSLGKNFELTFVGSSPGEQRKVEQWFLDNTCINRNQLTIRRYCSEQEELKVMFYQSDLVALPSRTEGFGLVALEAISAGVPVLVSGESGIAEALQKVEGGNTVVVGSAEDKDEWAQRIREMYEESAEERETNAVKLRENYRKVYPWKVECERFKWLIENVVNTANGTSPLTVIPATGHGKELMEKGQERKGEQEGMLPLLGYSTFEPDEFHMNLREQVTCSICLDIYKEPKILSCQHTFCSKCIEEFARLFQSQEKFRCPECQIPMDLPKENCLDRLPNSFFHQSLIDILQVADRKGMFPLPGSSIFYLEKEPEELHMKLQRMEESSTRNNKISVGRSKITEDGGVLMIQNVPSRVMIPPKALLTYTEVTCSLWNLQILSPPLGRNEALVSSVMELACGSLPDTKERYKFNVKVKLALSHSASDIKGYELVIKELISEKTNDWRDLETSWAWTPSDIGAEEFPDWLFPFAEAEITSFSSFAVVWRLKSFTFKSPSTLSSSFPCILSDHPGVSVTFPESFLPTGKTFALTVKVQEVPCSNAKLREGLVAGPILHISPSEPVQLLAPARFTIPVILGEDIPKCPDYSATDVRIFCRTSEEDESEWNEVTEQLENIAVLENGTVTFTVNHFSKYWVWIDRLKLPFVTLKNLADDFCRRLMLQEVGFFARLYATGNPTTYVLTLYCFPLHLREQVQTPLSPDLRRLCAQGGGNSRKPLCKEDWMSVSLSEAFTLMQEENLDNFLKFLGTDLFEESLRVSISDLSNLQVELYTENQSHRDKLCTLNFTPTLPDQTSSPRYFPSTAQVAMPEQKEDQVALESSTSFPSPKAPEETASNNFSKEDLKVTILADEWNSLKGGLSTFNRELAIHLASQSDTQVTFLVPHGSCGLEEKAAAAKNCVTIMEAKKLTACPSPVELFFPPKGLGIDVVIGHGVKLGQQAQIIRESHDCKWVQVVHTAPDELGMHKDNPKAIAQSEEKNQREVSLCEIADLVMAVGPKLKGFYSNHLRSFNKDQNVVEFTPGIMRELIDVKLSQDDNDEFQVLMFGRGDDEDFKLKGYDIVAEAFASHELKNDSYHLTFVGATPGKQDEFAAKILKFGISKNQLSVKEYIKDRNRLKELLLRMDLVIMPSRTEGFGLTALEALSAGLPILAGHNSGFSKALQKVRFGELCVVNSDKPEDWSKAIKKVRQKERKKRLDEMQRLREFYEQNYNWKEQCEILVKEMRRKVLA